MQALYNIRFLIMRRLTAISIILAFMGSAHYGSTILRGNLSFAELFGSVSLSDPFHLLQVLATGHAPLADAMIGGIIILLFYAVFAGRAFCSWVCPLNIVTDMAAWLRQRLGLLDIVSISTTVRYWAVALSLGLSAGMGIAAFEWISPISMLHRGIVFGMGMGWVVVAGVFLFDTLVIKNGFCGHLCPLGAFYSITGKYSLLRPLYNHAKCTDCGRCFTVCPERQVLTPVGNHSAPVSSSECTNCGRCIEVCTDKALGFSLGYINRIHTH